MDVASTMELQPLDSYAASGAVSSDELWTEADWIIWLPPYVAEAVATSRTCQCFQNFRTKVRFIEAVIFATVVLYIVAQAAMPAFQ
jgi:hypothetical protein